MLSQSSPPRTVVLSLWVEPPLEFKQSFVRGFRIAQDHWEHRYLSFIAVASYSNEAATKIILQLGVTTA